MLTDAARNALISRENTASHGRRYRAEISSGLPTDRIEEPTDSSNFIVDDVSGTDALSNLNRTAER